MLEIIAFSSQTGITTVEQIIEKWMKFLAMNLRYCMAGDFCKFDPLCLGYKSADICYFEYLRDRLRNLVCKVS